MVTTVPPPLAAVPPPLEKVAKIRRAKKNFVIEENIDKIKWPQECANGCGQPVGTTNDTLTMSKDFKGIGKVNVVINDIPYCQECYPRIKTGKTVNTIRLVVGIIIGIALGAILIIQQMQDQNTQFVFCGFILVISIFIGYGIAWLFVKLPAKLILGKHFAEPIDANLIEEKKVDGKQGMSVVLTIPNKNYAAKFATLNNVVG
jgi:hypothetical protein